MIRRGESRLLRFPEVWGAVKSRRGAATSTGPILSLPFPSPVKGNEKQPKSLNKQVKKSVQ